MTHQEMYLNIIRGYPGVTSREIWDVLWGEEANRGHGLRPEDCSIRLARMTALALVRREMHNKPRREYTYVINEGDNT